MEEEVPTDVVAPVNGRNELMDKEEEEEEPTDVVAPINGRNELMEKEEEEEPTDVVAPINGRNELIRLSDATKHDDDGESSTQCTHCGADYPHESLRRLLNQNPVQQPSYPFLRRHPSRSNDPLQESTAAVLKLGFTCRGCAAKIHQIVSITEGVKEIVIDKLMETVTFKATMEMKKLIETLRRRPVMGLPGRREAEYLQSQNDQYAGSELQQEMGKTQNDNIVRCDEDTSIHLGSEDGHQQDSSSSLRLRRTKSDAKEWAWVVMSLLFEGLSATFDQLGYTLTCMVMAYVALLFFVVELTLKARRERLTWAVGTSLLPCFRRCSAHNNSRNIMFVVSVVELFGLASALWQCFYSTMQYMYKSHNPLKLCLLPFLFVSCVFVSKFIRERKEMRRVKK